MATKGSEDEDLLLNELSKWQESTSDGGIFLLEYEKDCDGSLTLVMMIGNETKFKLRCPLGYPKHEDHFFVEADVSVKLWCNTLNEFLLDTPEPLTLGQVLSKASSLYGHENKKDSEEEDEMSVEDEEEDDEDVGGMILSDDDSAFTTEWELNVARKKKRWAQKEQEVREEMKRARLGPSTSELCNLQATGQEKEAAKQIFTSSAASGILTNDLVKIMEEQQKVGFTADPIEDNIYQWCVKLYNFEETSQLTKDLREVETKYGYKYIELQLDFAIDLYPFYPPLVKVIRPRLQASMMQRVTNMEMLKLSYWNPAKDMLNVLVDIKAFLQHWARLEVHSERNDRKRYPNGSYVDIEHHLLRLALVSEVNPRANIKYHLPVEKPPEARPMNMEKLSDKDKKQQDEYWAAGVGYGHSKRPEWDIKAYLAAQREKDKQIESVLHKILQELKILYANHAPQLKPRTVPRPPKDAESIDPVEDMYNILEGSALIPFVEHYLKADSFLEICRHTSVYKVIVDIIKEIAMQPQLVGLLGVLPDQNSSIYHLLGILENKANVLLQHICKAGNGSIPKPPKQETPKKGKERIACLDDDNSTSSMSTTVSESLLTQSGKNTAEEKLAREFQMLFKDVTEAFNRAGISPTNGSASNQGDAEVMDISITTDEAMQQQKPSPDMYRISQQMDFAVSQAEMFIPGDRFRPCEPAVPHCRVTAKADDSTAALEALYKRVINDMQFDTTNIDLEGPYTHNYANEYKKSPNLTQAQVFRIAQELTSLSSSLPLNLSSSIFVRTDEEKIVMMRALITGPEGTPYSCGCFVFDIYFSSTYPKTPPMVNLQTTGGGTVRFNPNLYNCGKVCLSLLGTWEGQQGEQWNEKASTVLQVLVSVQSLILVPEPYFNEPGFEQEIGTEAGKRHSQEYNLDVRLNNIKYAMVNQLQNPSPGFEDVIKTHFYLKRERIMKEVEGWVRSSKSSKLERAAQNLKTELWKIEPPPNLANLLTPNANSGKSETIMEPKENESST